MINIFKNLKKHEWVMLIVAVILVVLQVWIDLKLPEYTTNITRMFNTNSISTKKVLIQGGYLVSCALASMGLSIIVGFLVAMIGSGLAMTLREKLYDKVQSYSLTEIKRFSTASLITRTTNDVRQLQSFIAMGMQAIVKAPILAIWGILKLVGKSWEISFATFIGVFIVALVLVLIMSFAIPRFKKIQTLYDNLNRVTRENLTGVRVVRAYNAEEYEANRFAGANNSLAKNDVEVHRLMGLLNPVMSIVMSGLTLAIYCILAILINKASMLKKFILLGDIWVYTSWSMQIISAFMMIIMVAMMFPRVMVSVKRVNEVLNTDCSLKEGSGVLTDKKGEVEFRNVSFSYPDTKENCLHNISFSCKRGEVVAIIGATGSGKTSLINLIPRFYDATDGEVLVDGVNVKDYKISALNNKIGYISQRAIMLKGKISENVGLGEKDGEKPSADEILKALDVAQASDFVNTLEDGVDYEIAQGATNISGGQKQRINIARAISRNPEILIFDDSFSALDYKTDRNLRARLKSELKDTTCFIVAQRIGTIKNADKIIVLDNGEIVGMGKHSELLKDCSVYKEIALSQLNKEELDV